MCKLNLIATAFLGVFISTIILNVACSEEITPNTSAEKDDTEKTEDRINLNLNRGHAHAIGPYGSNSGSDAETYGVQTGIRGPGFHRPLYSHTGGRGSSYANGPFAPHTYAGGQTRFGNGYMGGKINAGFRGGQGVAQTHSQTHHIEIPLDPFGTVFYSNLKDNKDKKEEAVGETDKGSSSSSQLQSSQVNKVETETGGIKFE